MGLYQQKILEQRNQYDVTGTIQVTDPDAVLHEVLSIFQGRYTLADTAPIRKAFSDFQRMHRGQHPDFLACDTPYHDIQHSLDVTLTQTRLMDGYEQEANQTSALGMARFSLGIICALFHDIGYLRRTEESQIASGAQFTQVHVSRGIAFLNDYLSKLGISHTPELIFTLLHHTGYELPLDQLALENPTDMALAYMLGSADLITQMADRCYLEKCRDRLYPEFVAAGMAGENTPYPTPEELLRQTPHFFESMCCRLDDGLIGVYRYVESHFGGNNYYMGAVEQNLEHLDQMITQNNFSILRRTPPTHYI